MQDVVNADAGTQNTATTESTTVENNNSEVIDSNVSETGDFDTEQNNGETEVINDDGNSNTDSQSQNDVETNTENNQSQSKAEQRKEALNRDIRELVATRNSLRQQVVDANSQVYQPAPFEELLNQVNPLTNDLYSPAEAQVEIMKQERDIERYNQEVSTSRTNLAIEGNQALMDFPMFDETSPDYNPAIAAKADEVLRDSLQFDPNTGQLIGSTISPYKLMQSYAVAAQSAAQAAELKGQKNAEQMLQNVDISTGGGGGSRVDKSFESMSTSEQREYLRNKGHSF